MAVATQRALGVRRLERLAARELARRSRAWSDAVLPEGEAVLTVGVVEDEALVLGAFQRPGEIGTRPGSALRRGSGGAAARVGPGTVWIQLVLSRVDVLFPCTTDKLLNRYVRPILRGLTRAAGVPASYFGRDWISMAGRPVALVAFAHEISTGRSLVEAIVGVETPFAPEERPSFLGKPVATLDALAGRALDPGFVAEAVVDAYRGAAATSHDLAAGELPAESGQGEDDAPAWTATCEEAIGSIGAGPDASGRLRVGGALMASRDAIARLEARVAALAEPSPEEVGRAVDETLAAGGAVTFGVRSLAAVRDVIVAALRGRQNIA